MNNWGSISHWGVSISICGWMGVVVAVSQGISVSGGGMMSIEQVLRISLGLSRRSALLLILSISLPVSVGISVIASIVSSISIVSSVGMAIVAVVPAFGAGLSGSLGGSLWFGICQGNKQGKEEKFHGYFLWRFQLT